MKRLLQIKNIKKSYPVGGINQIVLNDLSLTIYEGEFISIMGPSGSGKTSLLNILSTTDTHYNGTLLFKGEEITAKNVNSYREHEIGIIFQEYYLLDALNVYDNIAIALTLNNVREIDVKVKRIVELLGIEKHLKMYPKELSGGQKQRVAIARALVKEPQILFCDEPTGALDSANSFKLVDYLLKLNQELGISIVMVTHDTNIAKHSHRVVMLNNGGFRHQLINKNDKEDFKEQLIKAELMLGEG